MRRPGKGLRALVLAVAVVLITPALGGARGGPDVRALRALVHQQLTLVKAGRFRAAYALTTPGFRARCPYVKFVRKGRETRRRLGPTAQVDRILVQFSTRRRALVQYRFLKNRTPFVRVRFRDRDRYTKIGSRWYDEYDRVAC